MSEVQRYRVASLDGTCESRIDARSFSDAAEEWAKFWLDSPDQDDVRVTLGEESKTFNVVRDRSFIEDTHDVLHQIAAKEITT